MSVIFETAGNTERGSSLGLWLNDGVYYAEIKHPAAESPIRVALHGISTIQEAWQALFLLGRPQDHLAPELALQ